MKWFKHFSDASTSLKLNRLMDDLGVEGYGQYWLLLELLADNFDGENTKITLHFSEISAKVRIKFGKKLETFVQKLADFSLLSCRISGKFYDFDVPILRELQDKDSKYNRIKRPTYDPKKKNKNKEEELEEEREIGNTKPITPPVETAVVPIKKPRPAKQPKEEPPTRATWESYKLAYMNRYGVEPVRNKTVNSKLKQFVDRIGLEESPLVASFYVKHNFQKYVASGHSIGNLLFDAEKLRTEWARNRQITTSEARHTETRQQVYNAFQKHLNASGGQDASNS